MCPAEDNVADCIVLPVNASENLRCHLGLKAGELPRIAYVPGPGDVAGSFDYWAKGEFDPRVPVIAYSTQFYTLIKKLGAIALLLHERNEPPTYKNSRFQFVTLRRNRVEGRWRYFIANVVYSLQALHKLRRFEPHIIILSTDIPELLLMLLPCRWRAVLTAHNTYWPAGRCFTRFSERLKFTLIRHALQRIVSAVCTSNECARQIAKMRENRTHSLFVETPQALTRHVPLNQTHNSFAPVRRLLYLGRIEKNKGIFDLLEVFETLNPQYPDANLTFAGAGSYAEELSDRVAKSSAQVKYLGLLSANDVHKIIDETDLLICPTRSSFNEGLAMVVVEAALHNVPSLVSSNVPAKDLFEDACEVFTVDDIFSLHEKLKLLLTDQILVEALRARLATRRDIFFNRSLSWGAQLYQAILC